MELPEFEDRLEVLGLLVGLFLAVAGVGTLLGQPWATAGSTTIALIQLVGIVVAVAVGIVTILVTQSKELDELLVWT